MKYFDLVSELSTIDKLECSKQGKNSVFLSKRHLGSEKNCMDNLL